MRQHELSFANFILRFGPSDVLMSYVEEIVLPAFQNTDRIRKHGDTEFRFYNTRLQKLGTHDGQPIVAITGHFVKDTMLRRQQIFRPDRGLVASEAQIESAPSAFFVLILNNHRLLYFAETSGAPSLESFGATAQALLREEWAKFIRERLRHENVTRRGVERLKLMDMKKRLPPPVLRVLRVAGEDAIEETIARFGKITQVRIKLIQPNDENDASEMIDSVEKTFRPSNPSRLEIVASQPSGLIPEEVSEAVIDASHNQNTEVIVSGLDQEGLTLKADNDEFALSTDISDPPLDDGELAEAAYRVYQDLVAAGKIKSLAVLRHLAEKIERIANTL